MKMSEWWPKVGQIWQQKDEETGKMEMLIWVSDGLGAYWAKTNRKPTEEEQKEIKRWDKIMKIPVSKVK